MPSRRRLLGTLGIGLAGVAGCLGSPDVGQEPATGDFQVSSSAIPEGETIPTQYTCDGADQSPPLSIADVPDGAASLALVLDDPDAPGGTFTHWLLWNLPVDRTAIPEAVPREPTVDALGGARQGTNDFDEVGYRGPCPPGDAVHTYRFMLYALDATLDVGAGESADVVRPAIDEHQLAGTQLTAPYG